MLDLFVFALCSVTGPFCMFLFVIALASMLRHKDQWNRLVTGVFLGGSLLQIGALLLHDRQHNALGAGVELFMRILGGQIYLGTLLGENTLSADMRFATVLLVTLAGTLVVLTAVRLAPEMRRFSFLSACLFVATLSHPLVYPVKGASAWEILVRTPGAHYWFFPSLAFGWSIIWCFRSRQHLIQIAAGCLAFLMLVGVIRDYRVPAFDNLNFAAFAVRLDQSPKGALVVIPQNPNGWQLKLVKH